MKALVKAEAAPGLTMKDIPEPTIVKLSRWVAKCAA